MRLGSRRSQMATLPSSVPTSTTCERPGLNVPRTGRPGQAKVLHVKEPANGVSILDGRCQDRGQGSTHNFGVAILLTSQTHSNPPRRNTDNSSPACKSAVPLLPPLSYTTSKSCDDEDE